MATTSASGKITIGNPNHSSSSLLDENGHLKYSDFLVNFSKPIMLGGGAGGGGVASSRFRPLTTLTGPPIKCSKFNLAQRSTRFASIFDVNVDLKDIDLGPLRPRVTRELFELCLKFMCTDTVDVDNRNDLDDLKICAETLGVKGLVNAIDLYQKSPPTPASSTPMSSSSVAATPGSGISCDLACVKQEVDLEEEEPKEIAVIRAIGSKEKDDQMELVDLTSGPAAMMAGGDGTVDDGEIACCSSTIRAVATAAVLEGKGGKKRGGKGRIGGIALTGNKESGGGGAVETVGGLWRSKRPVKRRKYSNMSKGVEEEESPRKTREESRKLLEGGGDQVAGTSGGSGMPTRGGGGGRGKRKMAGGGTGAAPDVIPGPVMDRTLSQFAGKKGGRRW